MSVIPFLCLTKIIFPITIPSPKEKMKAIFTQCISNAYPFFIPMHIDFQNFKIFRTLIFTKFNALILILIKLFQLSYLLLFKPNCFRVLFCLTALRNGAAINVSTGCVSTLLNVLISSAKVLLLLLFLLQGLQSA